MVHVHGSSPGKVRNLCCTATSSTRGTYAGNFGLRNSRLPHPLHAPSRGSHQAWLTAAHTPSFRSFIGQPTCSYSAHADGRSSGFFRHPWFLFHFLFPVQLWWDLHPRVPAHAGLTSLASAPATGPADPHITQESRDVDPEIIVKPNTLDSPRLLRSVTVVIRKIQGALASRRSTGRKSPCQQAGRRRSLNSQILVRGGIGKRGLTSIAPTCGSGRLRRGRGCFRGVRLVGSGC